MRTLKLFLLLAMFAVIACQNEVVVETKLSPSVESEVNTTSSDSSVVPMEQALKHLDEMIEKLYPATRSVKKPSYSISSVKTFVIPQSTRSNTQVDLPDTLVYVVPFDECDGYAILGAQSSISPVYAITEGGDFDETKFAEAIEYDINNNILTDEEYVERTATETENESYDSNSDEIVYSLVANSIIGDAVGDGPILIDPTPVVPPSPTPILVRSETYTQMEILEYYPPMITSHWYQGEPFNYNCKDANGTLCPAGCVVVAVAQVMAYHNIPANGYFFGFFHDWNVLKSYDPSYTYTKDDPFSVMASNLFFELGKEEYCNISYSPSNSSANMYDAKRALKAVGFDNLSVILGYGDLSRGKIVSMIKHGKPVPVGATVNGKKGHAMVHDGYITRRLKTTKVHYFSDGNVVTNVSYGDAEALFHICWGLDEGGHNGYYLTHNEINSEERYENMEDTEYTPDHFEQVHYTTRYRSLLYDLP